MGVDYVEYSRLYSNRFSDVPKACKDCDEYSMCDTCLGQTVNGYYDVVQLFHNVVAVPEKEICQYCRNHTRPSKICQRCKAPAGEQSIFGSTRLKAKEIEKFLAIPGYKCGPLQFFAVVDDCLSCS